MGQAAGIPGSGTFDRSNWPVRERSGSEVFPTARLSAGSSRPLAGAGARSPQPIGADSTKGSLRAGFDARAVLALSPICLRQVSPSQLGAFLMDVTVVSVTLAVGLKFLGPGSGP